MSDIKWTKIIYEDAHNGCDHLEYIEVPGGRLYRSSQVCRYSGNSDEFDPKSYRIETSESMVFVPEVQKIEYEYPFREHLNALLESMKKED